MEKSIKPIIGNRIQVADLQVNDLFYMEYGFRILKFRVKAILEDDGFLAHSVTWCESDSILVSFSDSRKIHYAGRMSKLRSFFLL